MSKFKIGLLAVFGIFILIGVAVFASTRSNNQDLIVGNVLIWGTVNSEVMNNFLNSFGFDSSRNLTATYVEKNTDTFDIELAEAVADGIGPDILLLSNDMLFKHKNKILTIPYTSYTERLFKDTFVEQSEMFLKDDGVFAIPFIIDPLVMYWNRDIFRKHTIIEPPKFWDDFLTLSPKLATKDQSGNILDSLVSFGEWRNVSNAKAILSTLFLQSGVSIVDNYGEVKLLDQVNINNQKTTPAFSVLNFYTQFANPTNSTYSWNRSLPKSQDFFISQNLATYFGFASELPVIRGKNPNLNFDITLVPQPRQNSIKITFSKIYAFSILKQSKKIIQAFTAVNTMTSNPKIKLLESFTNLPPIRKDLLSKIPADGYKSVFYQSAIFSKGWFDIEKKKTDEVFQKMIESVTSGRNSIDESIFETNELLNNLYEKQN